MDFPHSEAPGGRWLAYLPEPCVEPVLRTVLDGHLSAVGVLYAEYHSEADRRAIDALLVAREKVARSASRNHAPEWS